MKKALGALFALAIIIPVPGAFAASPVLTVRVQSMGGGSIPLGAQRVPMLHMQLAASCDGDVTLESIRVRHRGLGDANDLLRVYAADGGLRLTRGAAMRDEGTAVLQFRGMVIPACATRTMDILADISSDAAAAGEHGLTLESAADVVVDALAQVSLQASSSPSINLAPAGAYAGSITVEMLDLLKPLYYGAGRTVARLRLKALDRDQQILSVTMTNDGSAKNTDLRNLHFRTPAHAVVSSKAASLDGDRVSLVFDPPFVLRRNETKLLELRADIRASSRRTIRFIVQEPSDVDATRLR